MITIKKYPLRNFILISDKYKVEGSVEELEKMLDAFVKEHSSFKTLDEYVNAYNNLKNIDINTLINIAPDFGKLYNENEFIRLLDEYIRREND